jgi:hypothetical protein
VQLNALSPGEYQISLMSIQGKMVLQRRSVFNSGKSYIYIDMSSVAPGVYLLTIRQGTLKLEQKVIKQ